METGLGQQEIKFVASPSQLISKGEKRRKRRVEKGDLKGV